MSKSGTKSHNKHEFDKKELGISLITFNNIFKIKNPEKNIKKHLPKKNSLSTFVIEIPVLGTVFFFSLSFFHPALSSSVIFIVFMRSEGAVQRSYVKRCSYKFRKIHKKTPVPESLFLKETRAQVFSCEFCEISKNTVSSKTPATAASFSCKVWDGLLWLQNRY